ncbi:SPFH domain-containing protein [Candidatus Venteria ishoeyi]|uniref:Modulator of FtsH protease HflK n=1 Tax=Candidatus Venteria ishoeyi TaxID=1899563 RepID=A0A1H6FC88_9GAMM|nr:SPFH domain-containing protein [Candidatus Venteria ishoeyi]SEH07702.1 Modulator of FtsH protease HflK [Candidatus Venteria ishoeyi]
MEIGLAIISGLILLIAMTAIFLGFKKVPQGFNYTVERFGKYTRFLHAGPNFIIPFIEQVGQEMDMRERTIDIENQKVITKDNATVMVNGIIFYQVIDAAKAAYEVENYVETVKDLITTNVRGTVGSMELDELLSKREEISESILTDVGKSTTSWGIKIFRVKIKDIAPPEELAEAMNKQLTAERQKRAVLHEAEGRRQSEIMRAEGSKKAKILEAEGEKQAQILKAQAQQEAELLYSKQREESATHDALARERLAQAEAKATAMMSQALANGDVQAVNYFVAEKYIKAFGELAKAPNEKLVMLPMEATSMLGALQGIGEIGKDAFQRKNESNNT